MLFLVLGILKDDVEEDVRALSDAFNEHLAQPYRSVPVAGALRNGKDRRIGYMAFVEGEAWEEGDRYLRESPLFQAGLYERVEVAEFRIESGTLAGIAGSS